MGSHVPTTSLRKGVCSSRPIPRCFPYSYKPPSYCTPALQSAPQLINCPSCRALRAPYIIEKRPQSFCIDIDALVKGFDEMLTSLAWQAAQQLWPDHIVGSPGLFTQHMGLVLPAAQHLHESVLLLRLLIDEGVVGKSALWCDGSSDVGSKKALPCMIR
jgi:hypothetical protein